MTSILSRLLADSAFGPDGPAFQRTSTLFPQAKSVVFARYSVPRLRRFRQTLIR
jgi:hypothetical protein